MSTIARRDAARLAQRPGPDARGLPNHFFVDKDHFVKEQARLFQRTWAFAGVEAMLPGPGSIKHTEVAGVPLFFTRNANGEIRAFQNVCPHRGVRLVTEDKSKAAMLTCPYHAWSFDLDGKLKARPHFFGPGDHAGEGDEKLHACEGLFPVRVGTWNGALLVNIDGKAPPLEEFLAPLNAETEGYDLSTMRYGGMISSAFGANWKLMIENFLDSYHVFAVHPQLNRMMIPEQRKSAVGSGTLIYSDYYSTETGKDMRGGLPEIPNLPEEIRNASFFAAQFPNWLMSIHPAYLLLWHVVPLAVDETRIDVYAHFVGDAATDEAYADRRQELLDYYVALNAEDEGVCQLLQEGRRAPAYDGGRFSPYWDGGTCHFAQLVEQAMA